MKIIQAFALSFCLLFLFACNSSSGEEKGNVTANGYPYEHHIQNDGPKPQIGEYAYFNVNMRNPVTNVLTYESKDQSQQPRVAIPDLSKGGQHNPINDALVLMSIGDSLTVMLPIDTLTRKPAGYEDASSIAYDIVLTEIKTQEQFRAEYEEQRKEIEAKKAEYIARVPEIEKQVAKTAADYTAGRLNSKIQTTDSGLKYIIHEEGTGRKAKQGETVQAMYYGTLTDGTRFDDSFSKGRSFPFAVGTGQVIRGWDEGFALFNEGTKATLFIPSDLGYGAAGSPPNIPGGAELMFYVELEKVGR